MIPHRESALQPLENGIDVVPTSVREGAAESVPLEQLQGVVSRIIAELTGAEAGLVTSGAAAALLLGTAAILTGYDLSRIERLPHCEGFRLGRRVRFVCHMHEPLKFLLGDERPTGNDYRGEARGK